MESRSKQSMDKLVQGNAAFVAATHNPADISPARRTETAVNGQKPFAVILGCADSRTAPEHIFSAGIGELFVVRTAGNVVGNFVIASVEFAVKQFSVPLVVVMGHTGCGAVAAALGDGADGYVGLVVQEVRDSLNGATAENDALRNNVLHCKKRILQSTEISSLIDAGQVEIACALYDIRTGRVEFF